MKLSLQFCELILPKEYVVPMNGEKQPLVTNEPVEFEK